MKTKESDMKQIGKNSSTIILFSSAKKIRKLKVKKENKKSARQIEKIAREIKGVNNVRWGEKSDMLILKYDTRETNLDTIERAIANAGFDTPNYKGKTGVYAGMQSGYQYRKGTVGSRV